MNADAASLSDAVAASVGQVRVRAPVTRPTRNLGSLGPPGFLAYVALCKVGQPQAGETVLVAAGSATVATVAGQIAKLRGCRAVVLAEPAERRQFETEGAGFDACLGCRATDLEAGLRQACPDGIDVYFESAGGTVFNTVLPLLNRGARVPFCGMIDGRNAAVPSGKSVRLWYFVHWLATRKIRMHAISIPDHLHCYAEFVQEMSLWLDSGKLTVDPAN